MKSKESNAELNRNLILQFKDYCLLRRWYSTLDIIYLNNLNILMSLINVNVFKFFIFGFQIYEYLFEY